MTEERADVMAGLKGVFGTGAADDDDTRELRRPRGSGGLAKLLDAEPPPTETPSAPGPVSSPKPRPAAPRTNTAAPTPTGDEPATAPTPRRKTSLTMPPSLRQRLSQLYEEQRWTFAQLIDQAVQRLRDGLLDDDTLETRLRFQRREPSNTIKTVHLQTDVLDELDEIAGRLRMSRSQLVAAALADIADTLEDG